MLRDFDQVSSSAQIPTVAPEAHVHERLFLEDIEIEKEGYIYIYVSNQSDQNMDVYFDDLKVTHEFSDVVAGGDYYPFGLAIEDRQITREKYRYGYQGQFSEKDEETGWNHFELREYDPIVGRWLVTDPYREFWSPYTSMGNDPVNNVDPDGGCSTCVALGQFAQNLQQDQGFQNRLALGDFINPMNFLDEIVINDSKIDGLNWQGGWEASVRTLVPFGNDIYPEENNVIAATVPEWATPGGLPVKGAKWLKGFKNAETTAKEVGEFWKMTAKVSGKNGSYTIYTKVVNNHGRTVKWFHDTFDKTGKFLHRGWSEGATKFHKWWDGFLKVGEGAGPHVPR